MKKIIIPALAALMLVACGNKSQSTETLESANDSSVTAPAESDEVAEGNKSESGAKAAIEKIFNIYYNPGGYANEEEEEEADVAGFGFMTQFVSEEFNQSYCMAQSKQVSTGEMWLDCDPWIEAQDCEDLELVDVKIKEFKGDKAVADVKFKNFGELHTIGCAVIYNADKDAWLVDDLILADGGSVKKLADEFCSAPYEE